MSLMFFKDTSCVLLTSYILNHKTFKTCLPVSGRRLYIILSNSLAENKVIF